MCILKQFFYERVLVTRARLRLTQAGMADVLCMDTRSYVDLEHGKACCGALTLALFLLYCCEDPGQALDELKAAFEDAAKTA